MDIVVKIIFYIILAYLFWDLLKDLVHFFQNLVNKKWNLVSISLLKFVAFIIALVAFLVPLPKLFGVFLIYIVITALVENYILHKKLIFEESKNKYALIFSTGWLIFITALGFYIILTA